MDYLRLRHRYGGVCREYEILIGGHIVATPVDFIPALPLDAIYEDTLINRLVPTPIVMSGLGVVTEVAYMERSRHGIILHQLHYYTGKHQRTLSAKSTSYLHNNKCIE